MTPRRLPVARPLALVLAVLASACRPKAAPPGDAGAADAGVTTGALDDTAILAAEDLRRARDIGPALTTSHDVAVRRRAARALARIADAEALGDATHGLGALLADDDPETVAWAAYGLGYGCKGREDPTVRALAARVGSLPPSPPPMGRAELDPRSALARAIGRCAAPLSEAVLRGLLARPEWTDAALLGLGDLATRRAQLGPDALTAVLELAAGKTHDLAFYSLGRIDPGEAFAPRVVEVARAALARKGEARLLAIRALGRSGKVSPREAAPELGRVVADAKGFDAGERAEAARALSALGSDGTAAVLGALSALTPDAKDALALQELAGASYHVLVTLLDGLGAEAPKKAEASLGVLASLKPPSEPTPAFARRLATIRCSAALALARGAYDADILSRCDADGSEIHERARLTALLRRPLAKERLAAFRVLARSEHLRIREAAVEAIGAHPEVGEAGATILAEALSAKQVGLVATAAETLNAHPERGLVLAEKEKRAALDPRSPPPTATPAQEVAPAVAKALGGALTTPWPESAFETRVAVLDAAAALHLPGTKDVAQAACLDGNPVVRERGLRALRTLGAPPCEGKHVDPLAANELTKPVVPAQKLVLSTDTGELTIVLEPTLAPITAERLTILAETKFFDGVVVHRVVPGFVVQLGDPEGDGYGGAAVSLRCETSPVPFGPLDVGMALAGRDTGSSQFFVTLARTPHLDGEYTRVGRAEGDWASVAQGDVVRQVRVVR